MRRSGKQIVAKGFFDLIPKAVAIRIAAYGFERLRLRCSVKGFPVLRADFRQVAHLIASWEIPRRHLRDVNIAVVSSSKGLVIWHTLPLDFQAGLEIGSDPMPLVGDSYANAVGGAKTASDTTNDEPYDSGVRPFQLLTCQLELSSHYIPLQCSYNNAAQSKDGD